MAVIIKFILWFVALIAAVIFIGLLLSYISRQLLFRRASRIIRRMAAKRQHDGDTRKELLDIAEQLTQIAKEDVIGSELNDD